MCVCTCRSMRLLWYKQGASTQGEATMLQPVCCICCVSSRTANGACSAQTGMLLRRQADSFTGLVFQEGCLVSPACVSSCPTAAKSPKYALPSVCLHVHCMTNMFDQWFCYRVALFKACVDPACRWCCSCSRGPHRRMGDMAVRVLASTNWGPTVHGWDARTPQHGIT